MYEFEVESVREVLTLVMSDELIIDVNQSFPIHRQKKTRVNEFDPTMATRVWEAVKSVTCYSISKLSRVPNEPEEKTMSDQSHKELLRRLQIIRPADGEGKS